MSKVGKSMRATGCEQDIAGRCPCGSPEAVTNDLRDTLSDAFAAILEEEVEEVEEIVLAASSLEES